MEISIDTSNELPMFAQLIAQIKQAVITGELTAGLALPPIRQLASDLGINQNTVAKAYKVLERDKVIVAKGYKGTFVHDDAKANSVIDWGEKALSIMDSTVLKLRDAGLTDSEIRLAFTAIMKKNH
ncbi:MAG: GntR family transcriptional regulator [Gammaproteobacteria bacterium]|nr:MAG: GntR family transcriptional regulator [Gammaproteobacteria bacterium]